MLYRRIPPNYELWGLTEVAKKSVYGKDAVFPFYPEEKGSKHFKDLILGYDMYPEILERFRSLDDIILLPPQFTPRRLEKAMDLIREPIYADVDTEATLGGFRVKLPVVVAAMGSTGVSNRRGLDISKGSAKAGIVNVIGENVVTVRGYDRRLSDQPCFKERALAYLENIEDGYGGLVIQQNVEDANFELWKRVYSDPDFDQYIQEGLIGFEIKGGQGAKPGLGGEIRVSKEVAKKLMTKFYFPEDPEKADKDWYDRHSVPGTFTRGILREQIRGMVNEYRSQYRRVRIWVKTGPYRDLSDVIRISEESGADAITIDGKEGGTGMAPTVALRELGYPTLVCLKKIYDAKNSGARIDMMIAGGLTDGADIVKSLCLGADGVAMGRAFIVASEATFGPLEKPNKVLKEGWEGVVKFVDALKVECQLLASALGKYSLKELSKEDVGATKEEISRMFGIEYIYAP